VLITISLVLLTAKRCSSQVNKGAGISISILIGAAKLRDTGSSLLVSRASSEFDKMLTTTHLAVVILIGFLLPLDRNEWLVLLTFGVMLDFDHVFAAPRYIGDNGWAAVVRPTWDDGSGEPYKSLFHDSVAFFVVGPLAIGWRFMLPLLAWSSHVGLDWLQNNTLAYSAPVESVVLIVSCAGIVWFAYMRWSEIQEETSFGMYVLHLRDSVKAYLSP